MKMLHKFSSSLFLGILAAGLVAGCVTKREIQAIVTDSNAAFLGRQLGADTDTVITVKGKGKSNALDAASARIDAFIAAHPDQPDAAAALRIRQGMLLLSAGEPELAQAAFSRATNTHLHTPRDRTLKEISAHLAWWFGGASKEAFDDPDYPRARQALTALGEQQAKLSALARTDPEAEGIRDYVAETRAWIGLRYTSALPQGQADEARRSFVDTVTNYLESLGPTVSQRIACGCKCAQTNVPPAITLELRRCFRAREVLKYAFEVRRDSFGPNPPPLPEATASLVQDWR